MPTCISCETLRVRTENKQGEVRAWTVQTQMPSGWLTRAISITPDLFSSGVVFFLISVALTETEKTLRGVRARPPPPLPNLEA